MVYLQLTNVHSHGSVRPDLASARLSWATENALSLIFPRLEKTPKNKTSAGVRLAWRTVLHFMNRTVATVGT